MKVIGIIFLIMLLCFSFACATESGKTLNIIANGNIESFSTWSNDDQLYILTVENTLEPIDDKEIPVRKLNVYKKGEAGYTKTYEYDAGMDHLVGMFPLGVDSNVYISIWVGGSAYHIIAISLDDDSIVKALDVGTHNYPEFADIDNDGLIEILISEPSYLTTDNKIFQFPNKTQIYKYTDNKYILVKTISWRMRFAVNHAD